MRSRAAAVGVPHTAAEAKLNLRYDSARLSANLGGTVTPGGVEIDHDGAKWKAGGIYDRDPKWQAHANLGLRVGDNTRMSAQLSFIRYTSDDTAVVGALAARTACPLFDKLDCTLSTGFIGQGTATLPDVVRPFANFSVGTRFDTK